jgi:hypothetical protein
MIEVLNLGGGVQSTTLALMSVHGELPRLSYAIFADTGWEPRAVYEHLDWLEGVLRGSGIDLLRVRAKGDGIVADHLAHMRGEKPRVEAMPFRIVAEDGTPGAPILRKCTRHYKHRPIERAMTQLRKRHPGESFRQWLGISYDEIERMAVGFWHPLIEERMLTRGDCQAWLAARGYSAPRSACIGCPYHDNREWSRMKAEAPDEFAAACAFDAELRKDGRRIDGIRGEVFLHPNCKPLAEADVSVPVDRQQSFIECSGGCFL